MGLVNRFSATYKGNIVCIGGTLGLAKTSTADIDMGAFTTLDNNKQVIGYPPASTLDWRENSGCATLSMPMESEVLYAELVWGGSLKSNTEDISSFKDVSIIFHTPGGSNIITPDRDTSSFMSIDNLNNFYLNSQNVTHLIKEFGSGEYAIRSVPGTIGPSSSTNYTNCCGWNLIVIYKNENMKLKNTNLFVGQNDFNNDEDLEIGEFMTSNGKKSKLIVSNVCSDLSNKENIFCGSTLSNLQRLNPMLYTKIEQERKYKDAETGWNVYEINTSLSLENSSGKANIKFVKDTDLYVLNFVLFDVEVEEINVSLTQYTDKEFVLVGDEVKYCFEIRNNSMVKIKNVLFKDVLPLEMIPKQDTIKINNKLENVNLSDGIKIDLINMNDPVDIEFFVQITDRFVPYTLKNSASIDFDYYVGRNLFSNRVISNQTDVKIEKAAFIINGIVNKPICFLEDIISYEFLIVNVGSINFSKLSMKFSGADSLEVVGGNAQLGTESIAFDLKNEFNIASLESKDNISLRFDAKLVDSQINAVELDCSVIANISIDSYEIKQLRKTSNMLYTKVEKSSIEIARTVNKNIVLEGDIVTNIIMIKNSGSLPIKDIFIKDIIGEQMHFIENSLLIDNIIYANEDIVNGVNLDKILNSQEILEVRFDTKVKNNILANDKKIKSSFVVRANGMVSSKFRVPEQINETKDIVLNLETALVKITKKCNAHSVCEGDILENKIELINAGSIDVKSALIKDSVQDSMDIVKESIKLDGEILIIDDFSRGIDIGSILKNQMKIIEFKTVAKKNRIGIVQSKVNLNATFVLGSYEGISRDFKSNFIEIKQMKPSAVIKESVNKNIVVIKDILDYDVEINNNGDTDLFDCLLKLEFPEELEIVDSRTYIGDRVYEIDIDNSINLADLKVGEIKHITFKGKVKKYTGKEIINTSLKLIAKISNDKSVEFVSNGTSLTLKEINLEVEKSFNKESILRGNQVTCNINVKNKSNMSINNVIIKDNIPIGLTFVKNTLKVNDVFVNDSNPKLGIKLGNLEKYENADIEFEVVADTLIQKNKFLTSASASALALIGDTNERVDICSESNQVNLNVEDINLKVMIDSSKDIALSEENINFKITVFNDGSVTGENIILKFIIDDEMIYIPNTLYINSILQDEENPLDGLNLGNIQCMQEMNVEFNLKVPKKSSNGIVHMSAQLESDFLIDNHQRKTYQFKSNEKTIKVEQVDIMITQSCDKEVAIVEDTVLYNVNIKNTGTIALSNVNLVDIIPKELIFIPSTLIVNNEVVSGESLELGVNLGNLQPLEIKTVEFKAKVHDVSINKQAVNNCYCSALVNSDMINFKIDKKSSKHMLKLEKASIKIIAKQSKSKARVGEHIAYDIDVFNDGNLDIHKLYLEFLLPYEVQITSGEFANKAEIFIGDLLAGAIDTIKVDAKVTSYIDDAILTSRVKARGEFFVNDDNHILFSRNSNEMIMKIQKSNLKVTKEVNKEYAKVGDVLNCKIIIKNDGDIDVSNLNVMDVVPYNFEILSGSIKVQNVLKLGTNLLEGITIPILESSRELCIEYSAKIKEIGDTKILKSKCIVKGEIEKDDCIVCESNEIVVNVEDINLSATMNVEKGILKLDDIVNCEVVIQNISTIEALDVEVEFGFLKDVKLIEDKYFIDDKLNYKKNSSKVLQIGNIVSNSKVVLKFKVQILKQKDIVFFGTLTGNFAVNPFEKYHTIQINTNEVITQTKSAKVDIVKEIENEYIEVGDFVNCNVYVANVGSLYLESLMYQEGLGKEFEFVEGYYIKNGLKTNIYNIEKLNLGSLDPQDDLKMTYILKCISESYEYKEMVSKLKCSVSIYENDNCEFVFESNPVKYKSILSNLQINQRNDTNIILVGDTINYFIDILNVGNVIAKNIHLKSIISENVTFSWDSLFINGENKQGLDPFVGININDLYPGEKAIVSYSVKVNKNNINNSVDNKAIVEYKYSLNESNELISKLSYGEETKITVKNLDIQVEQICNKDYVVLRENVEYTVKVRNNGNVIIENTILNVNLPKGVSFIEDTLTVNGLKRQCDNILDGIIIGVMTLGKEIVVKFGVLVDFNKNLASSKMKSDCFVDYNYSIDIYSTQMSSKSYSNESLIKVASPNFKELTLSGILDIPDNSPYIDDIVDYSVEGEILSYHIIRTPQITSIEGQVLTGSKIIVQGIINIVVEYVANISKQSIYSANFKEIFNTFIVLPNSCTPKTNVAVNVKIEDAVIEKVDTIRLFKNIVLRLEAIIRDT